MVRLIENIIFRFKRTDRLVRLKATGTPQQLARRLGISTSTLYENIKTMRSLFGAPIRYCRFHRSYVYEEEGKLELSFKKPKKC